MKIPLPEQMFYLLQERWGSKTLGELHSQALLEKTGLMFDAVREAQGRRFLLAMCVTGSNEVAMLSKVFEFDFTGPTENWENFTLLEMCMRNVAGGGGLCFEPYKDSDGVASALVLMATDPKSMAILEKVFTLPP